MHKHVGFQFLWLLTIIISYEKKSMAYHWQVLLFLLLQREKKKIYLICFIAQIHSSIYCLKILRISVRRNGQNYNHVAELILASLALTNYMYSCCSISIDLLSRVGERREKERGGDQRQHGEGPQRDRQTDMESFGGGPIHVPHGTRRIGR